MLTEKCQKTVSLLLTEDDFNVRITVAKNATFKSILTQNSIIDSIWKEYIRDSIGEILYTDRDYFAKILIVKNETLKKVEDTLNGKQIAYNLFLKSVLDADGIRLTITQMNGKKLSWIIVRP